MDTTFFSSQDSSFMALRVWSTLIMGQIAPGVFYIVNRKRYDRHHHIKSFFCVISILCHPIRIHSARRHLLHKLAKFVQVES